MTAEPFAATSSNASPAHPAHPDRLGPLVRADGRWTIGDPEGKAHLVLTPEGLEHHVTGKESHPVPWGRLMELNVAVTVDSFFSSPLGGLFSKTAGITTNGSCLRAMVRHPYDMWSPHFTHHHEFYSAREITLLQSLLVIVVHRGRADLLGDDAWLTTAVRRLAAHRPRSRWRSGDDGMALVESLVAQAP
ncbi:hypothetical protein ACFVHB_03580 [Kitasatospora sp. NPDC127111]|uniref:hypothetical protein n=1 Tax=Kitasatospora sp. NPDC127111 TaxID=3345363 RepID=UPI0036321A32